MKRLKHLMVVIKHKHYVFKYACKLGIPFLGLVHDLSKFSFTEFELSVKYFDGTKSPTIIERESNEKWSNICVHHVGRNKHHWHYYVDYLPESIIIREIPFKRVIEYVCDIISASKVYHPNNFNMKVVYDYFLSHSKNYLMHPQSKEFILWCTKSIDEIGFKKTKKLLKNKYNELHIKYGKTCIEIPFEEINMSYLKLK